MKLASVRVVTRDVTALAAFYSAITGISPVGDGLYSEVRIDGCTLAIADAGLVEGFHPGQLTPASNQSAILEFEVDDVDGVQAQLANLVSDWVQLPTTMPWGNRSMLFRDPDGNLINIYAKAPHAA